MFKGGEVTKLVGIFGWCGLTESIRGRLVRSRDVQVFSNGGVAKISRALKL